MYEKQSFTILFWIKRNRIKIGKAPLFARVTINGKRMELAVGRETSVLEWDARAQMVDSKTKAARDTIIYNHPIGCIIIINWIYSNNICSN